MKVCCYILLLLLWCPHSRYPALLNSRGAGFVSPLMLVFLPGLSAGLIVGFHLTAAPHGLLAPLRLSGALGSSPDCCSATHTGHTALRDKDAFLPELSRGSELSKSGLFNGQFSALLIQFFEVIEAVSGISKDKTYFALDYFTPKCS